MKLRHEINPPVSFEGKLLYYLFLKISSHAVHIFNLLFLFLVNFRYTGEAFQKFSANAQVRVPGYYFCYVGR